MSSEEDVPISRGQAFVVPDFPGSTTKASASPHIASKPKPPPTKISRRKGKISRVREWKITHTKVRRGEGTIMTVEKENIKCIFGECPKICPSFNEFKKHLTTAHGVSNSHTSGIKIDCPVSGCTKQLGEGSMMRHMVHTHADAIRVVCAICEMSCTRIDALRAHINDCHGENSCQDQTILLIRESIKGHRPPAS